MSRSFGKSNASPGTVPDKIRNIGPKSAAWLRQIGVRTDEDVKRLGALECFLKVRKAGFKAGLNLLYALAGAEADCHWQDIGNERKQSLLLAFNAEVDRQPKMKGGFPSKHGSLGAKLVSAALGDGSPGSGTLGAAESDSGDAGGSDAE